MKYMLHVSLIMLTGCGLAAGQIMTVDYDALRERMVETTIENPPDHRRAIRDPKVLAAMRTVDRHELVPESIRFRSYEDRPLPIGEDQTISQPFIVALMTELLELKGHEKVLEIGTGSGYQAAVLAEIVGATNVYTIEIVEPLGQRAIRDLERLGYGGVQVKIGDGYAGWPEHAPFDAVILTAAPPSVPQPLIDQLAEGGVLVAPVGRMSQQLVVMRKVDGEMRTTADIPVRFVPMTGRAQEE